MTDASGVAQVTGVAAEPATPTGVRATARLRAHPTPRGTSLPTLESSGPLALRRTRETQAGEANVLLVGAMSGPLGGDRFRVEAGVDAGARLRVGSAAATIALPGPRKGEARYDVHLEVAAGAELRWLPEPLISAQGSDLYVTTRIDVEEGARLTFREEQILGRAGEQPGRLTSRLTLRAGERLLLDQELACGPGAPGGWDGPAVLGGHRAIGQLLVVRPEFADTPVPVRVLADGAASVVPLNGPAVLVTALAPDGLVLRRLLDEALAGLG